MAGPSKSLAMVIVGTVMTGVADSSLLERVVLRLAVGQTQPPPVVVGHDGDVIGVGER